MSVSSTRTHSEGYQLYLITLQRPKKIVLEKWFRYSTLRSAAERLTDSDMNTFPRKTSLFESSTNSALVHQRRSDMMAWLSRTAMTEQGMTWLETLLDIEVVVAAAAAAAAAAANGDGSEGGSKV